MAQPERLVLPSFSLASQGLPFGWNTLVVPVGQRISLLFATLHHCWYWLTDTATSYFVNFIRPGTTEDAMQHQQLSLLICQLPLLHVWSHSTVVKPEKHLQVGI